MLKLINNSTAFYGTGLSIQHKLFKIKSGQYAGRMAAVYPIEPSTIVLSYADPPYLNWSNPKYIIYDSADYPAACWMDADGDIFIVYTQADTLSLVSKRIYFSNASWISETTGIVCASDSNFYPNLFRDGYGRLWVSWTRLSIGTYYLNCKASVDDGGQWGAGPEDLGYSMATSQLPIFSRFEYLPTYIYCFYTKDGASLMYRRFEIAGSVWHSETEVFSGSNLGGNFNTAVSDDLRVGLTFAEDSGLYFKDFDGASWSGNHLLDSDVSLAPVVIYNGAVPFVFYGKEIGPQQSQMYYCFKNGAIFTAPARVTGELSSFDRVLCYRPDAMAQHYDRTTAAADDTPADIYHPDTGKLLQDSGDALLLGQADRFNQVHIALSTNGAGGVVRWYYWDGSNWKNFTPSSGDYNFDSSPAEVRLWEDGSQIPSDWQSSVIAGHSKFWIRVAVNSDFGTAPVGTQITAATGFPYMTGL